MNGIWGWLFVQFSWGRLAPYVLGMALGRWPHKVRKVLKKEES